MQYHWVLFISFLIVVIVKYYTAVEMRKLERRLESVRADLQQVKEKLQATQDHQQNVGLEEETFAERVRRMREVIEDLQLRLTAQEEVAEAKVISSGASFSARPF